MNALKLFTQGLMRILIQVVDTVQYLKLKFKNSKLKLGLFRENAKVITTSFPSHLIWCSKKHLGQLQYLWSGKGET